MKLDERFMTILTVILVLVGVGALLNRGEDGNSFLSGSGSFRAQPDNFTLRAGRLQSLDVLLNDSNPEQIDSGTLRIVSEPFCGRAEAVNGAIQYSDSANCSGTVKFTYCVPEGPACDEATVVLNVLRVEEGGTAVAKNPDGSPVVVEIIQQGAVPQDQPLLAMKQPMRLTLPTDAEVITPAQAAQEIRSLGRDAGQSVVADNQSDSAIVVSNTSARSGSVATAGISMQTPDPGGEDLQVALASPQDSPSVPGRSSAPSGLAVTSVESPRFSSAPSISLSVPQPPQSPEVDTATSGNADSADVPQTEVAAVPKTAPIAGDSILEAAPLAQSNQPAAPDRGRLDVPENSGVLASIARNNTVFGVTLSAAKALLSPSEAHSVVVSAPAGSSAPRPQDIQIISALNQEVAVPAPVTNRLPAWGARPGAPRQAAVVRLASLSTTEIFVPRTRPATRPVNTEILTDTDRAPETTLGAETELVSLQPLDAEPRGLGAFTPVLRPSVDCQVDMVLKVRVGAEILATLSSPCRPETPFVVEHSGLKFTGFTDIDGVADFLVPAMAVNATVSVAFDDGAFTVAQTEVENMSRLTRVAVIWDGDVDFDLHAFEFGAAEGDASHIHAGNSRDYRTARRAGGGYLMQLGPEIGLGRRAEVYTIFESSRTKDGIVDLQMRLAGSGDSCSGAPTPRAIRSDAAQVTDQGDIDLNLNVCGGEAQVVLEDVAGDIDMAQR